MLTATRSLAHPADTTSAVMTIKPDGSFRLNLRISVLPLALQKPMMQTSDAEMLGLVDGPHERLDALLADEKVRFAAGVNITDGRRPAEDVRLDFPTGDAVRAAAGPDVRPRVPAMMDVDVRGTLPAGALGVQVRLPESLGGYVLVVDRPEVEPYAAPVAAGATSALLPVRLTRPPQAGGSNPNGATSDATQPHAATAATTGPTTGGPTGQGNQAGPAWINPATSPATKTPDYPPIIEPGLLPPPEPEHRLLNWPLIGYYLKLGFEHILPKGLDHILFVLGLFLLNDKLRPLLLQVTAFTVAHSVTLALSLYGIVRLPPEVVEPLIAVSIAVIAIENILTSRLHAWRLAVVFGFGLIHGLGFAGILLEQHLPRRDFLPALAGFNVGVECGQLTVVLLAWLAVGWMRHRRGYRRWVVIPASAAIAAVAIYWTFERIFVGI